MPAREICGGLAIDRRSGRDGAGRFTGLYQVLPGFTRRGADMHQLKAVTGATPHHSEKSQEVQMRMAMLALVAALAAMTLTGPAMAQTAPDPVGCPAGYQWVPGQYDRLGVYQPGHCESLDTLWQWHS
jgi:hypothetical protein